MQFLKIKAVRCKMNNQPIGFMDSGVGGLSVVKEVMKRLPDEEIQFIGDSARNPYGTRSAETVLQYSKELAEYLLKKQIKLLVVACNTATAAAYEVLKKELDIPVIGVIEPGSRAAVVCTNNHTIGVIGTEGTIRSGEYNEKIKQLNEATKIYSSANPAFVDIVEKNQFKSTYAKEIVAKELEKFKYSEIDTLVLGCTHYPLLEPLIKEYLGEEICLIDPSVETAKTIEKTLNELDLLNNHKNIKPNHVFYTTGSAEKFQTIAVDWLGTDNFCVEHVSVEELEETNEKNYNYSNK